MAVITTVGLIHNVGDGVENGSAPGVEEVGSMLGVLVSVGRETGLADPDAGSGRDNTKINIEVAAIPISRFSVVWCFMRMGYFIPKYQ